MDTDVSTLPDVVSNGSSPIPSAVAKNRAEEKGMFSKLWTDGVFIMFATAAVYAGCYFHELGFASYYNIPEDMIVISIQNILSCVGMVIAFAIMGFHAAITGARARVLSDVGRPNDLASIWFDYHGLACMSLLLLITLAKLPPPIVYFGYFMALVPLLLEFVVPTRDYFSKTQRERYGLDGLTSYFKHVEYHVKLGRLRSDDVILRRQDKISLCLVFLITAVWLCFIVGIENARGRSTFPFLGDSSEVILRRYGESFVIGRIDQNSGKMLSEFRLVKADDLKDRIVMKNVGKIEQMKVRQQDVRTVTKPAVAPLPVLPKGAPGI